MTCNEFEEMMESFISGELKYHDLNRFISHLHNCKDCYDDLEVFYMANYKLRNFEQEEPASYNFKGELEQMINDYEKWIKRYSHFQMITKVITISANIVMVIVLVMGILAWFNVL